MKPLLRPEQLGAVRKLKNGCILCGGVGSGKSRTALAYYYLKQGGTESFLRGEKHVKMQSPRDLYVITTARKRDTFEWEQEMAPFLLSPHPESCGYTCRVVVDSWNNIGKYLDISGAFFLLDEQRVIGKGAWVKSFLRIAKQNDWILLSATPGDTWQDYIPVFLANGFYRNRTEFLSEHVQFSRTSKFPKIERYFNTGRLSALRDRILVDIPMKRNTVRHMEDVFVSYDRDMYRKAGRTRWNPFTEEPMQNASELCFVWRKIVNQDTSRALAVLELAEAHPKLIVFYNYDYELDILRSIQYPPGTELAEWNGHIHQPLPESSKWVYLVQYAAGCEGWNCVKTDTVVFYSQNYSYKVLEQACGRIDRMNTPYTDLYYYQLKSRSPIDLAIERAVKEKKTFNESRFVKW